MSLNRTYNLDWCNSVFEYVSPLVYIDKRGIVTIVTTGLCLLSTRELLYVIGYKDQHLLNLLIVRTWISTLETWIKCANSP